MYSPLLDLVKLDVKLSQYLAYTKALKPYQGTEEYDIVMYEKAINHFCNLSTDMLRKLPMENYNGIMNHIQELKIYFH